MPDSLAVLLPIARVALDVTPPANVSATTIEWTAWTAALTERLAEEGLEIAEPDVPGTSIVHIQLTGEDGPGRTDAGTAFHATRYTASVRIHRASTSVRGTHAVSADLREAQNVARYDLIERIVEALVP